MTRGNYFAMKLILLYTLRPTVYPLTTLRASLYLTYEHGTQIPTPIIEFYWCGNR